MLWYRFLSSDASAMRKILMQLFPLLVTAMWALPCGVYSGLTRPTEETAHLSRKLIETSLAMVANIA